MKLKCIAVSLVLLCGGIIQGQTIEELPHGIKTVATSAILNPRFSSKSLAAWRRRIFLMNRLGDSLRRHYTRTDDRRVATRHKNGRGLYGHQSWVLHSVHCTSDKSVVNYHGKFNVLTYLQYNNHVEMNDNYVDSCDFAAYMKTNE